MALVKLDKPQVATVGAGAGAGGPGVGVGAGAALALPPPPHAPRRLQARTEAKSPAKVDRFCIKFAE
jgi:hypothetical protein